MSDKKLTLSIYENTERSDEGIVVEGVDTFSLVDEESHGPARHFGVTADFTGRAVLVFPRNTVAVVVDR